MYLLDQYMGTVFYMINSVSGMPAVLEYMHVA